MANGSIAVPGEHGVNGFGELGATTFVDAARVDPCPHQLIFDRLLADVLYFLPASFLGQFCCELSFGGGWLHIVKEHLLFTPCVREDGVAAEFCELVISWGVEVL